MFKHLITNFFNEPWDTLIQILLNPYVANTPIAYIITIFIIAFNKGAKLGSVEFIYGVI